MPKKVKIGLCVIGALVLGAAIWFIYGHLANQKPQGLVLYGNVDIRQVDLGFRVGGRIAEVLVEEGAEVEGGQPLARLERDILLQKVEQAQAMENAQKADLEKLLKGYRAEEVAQARATVAANEAVAANAAINLRRVSGLRASNAISQRELDNARAADAEARAKLRQAKDNLEMLASGYREEEVKAQEASVAQASAQLKLAQIQLEDAVLHAPHKGVVLTRVRETGAIVQEGQTVYTLTLVDPVWIRAYVAEPNLGKIRPGMKVHAMVDCAPGKKFPGTIGFISPTAEFTPKTVETPELRTHLVYRIRVTVEDPENVMRQGMPVTLVVEDDAG